MNRFIILLVITSFSFIITNSCNNIICSDESELIPDPVFEKAIRDVLNKPEGIITKSELKTITKIIGISSVDKITNIAGIEYCINLEVAILFDNNISDISSLKNLTKLNSVNLSYNNIADPTPLNTLTHLITLGLSENPIQNFDFLTNLIDLSVLWT